MNEVVAILEAGSFNVLFDGSSPLRMTVRETSKITSWPVEDGTQRSDHRVLDPVEIDLSMLITDSNRNLFERLRQTFLEGRELIVQTQVRSYGSMMIMDMPHDELVEQGDSVPVALKLKEVKVIKPEFGTLPPSQVANPRQSSTVQRGGQQTAPADEPTRRKSSTLYRVVN